MALTLLAALGISGCTSRGAAPEETEPHAHEAAAERLDRVELAPEALDSLQLGYATVEERELLPSVEVPAEIIAVPDRRATIGPRVAGRVTEIRVNVGDQVARGAVLAVLESEEVGRAWADLIAATARQQVAAQARDRQRRLLEERIAPERAVEEAEGAFLVAEADLQAARTRLATYGVTPSEAPPENPARVLLTSPIAGTVVGRWAHVGQRAEPSGTLAEIVDLDEVWLDAAVYERDMRLVSPGQPVQVEVRAFPDEVVTGAIAQVAGTLDERTRTVAVRIVLPNPGHRLRPGMFATARIQGTHDHDARRLLAMPWTAVQDIDEHRTAFVRINEGVFELRRIHTGERAGELVEVLNGLEAGEQVVTEGSFLLKGQLLRSTLGDAGH
jgi:cobalt-zinc-cadmium efflux system membrane fusion protein